MSQNLRVALSASAILPLFFACGGSKETSAPAVAAPVASSQAAPGTAPGDPSPPPAGAPSAAPLTSPPTSAAVTPAPGAAPAHPGEMVQIEKSKKPVAMVNGRPVPAERAYSMYQMSKSMLQQRGKDLSASEDQALKAESLQLVLADELLYQAAVAQGIKASPAEVDAEFKKFKTRVGTDEAYQKFLAGTGLTESDVRQEIERNYQTETFRKGLLAGRSVTEAQAKKYYDTNVAKGVFNVPEQVHVQYILVKATDKDSDAVKGEAKKRAEEAARRAAAGEDFAALAKQYSQDQTASRGGDIGLVPRGVMFPKFEEVAFAAKPGTVSEVFETPKGFNVMKVLEKKPESTRTYAEVKETLMAEMGRFLEQDVVQTKVRELAATANIQLLDRSFAPPAPPAAPPQAAKP